MPRPRILLLAAVTALLAAAAIVPALSASAATAPAAPYGDSNLVSMFDGTSLKGWTASDPKGFVVKGGAIHTTGNARGWLRYNTPVGTFRIIFQVRQVVGTGHYPTVLFWGTTTPIRDALSAIQFQPPVGYVWDYRPGHNNDARALVTHYPRPTMNVKAWNQCEIIGNSTTGVARMACGPVLSGKTTLVVQFKDKTAARVGPFAIQVHNAGIQDEYRNLYVESPVKTSPDQLITTK
jgi:hypothetical protein